MFTTELFNPKSPVNDILRKIVGKPPFLLADGQDHRDLKRSLFFPEIDEDDKTRCLVYQSLKSDDQTGRCWIEVDEDFTKIASEHQSGRFQIGLPNQEAETTWELINEQIHSNDLFSVTRHCSYNYGIDLDTPFPRIDGFLQIVRFAVKVTLLFRRIPKQGEHFLRMLRSWHNLIQAINIHKTFSRMHETLRVQDIAGALEDFCDFGFAVSSNVSLALIDLCPLEEQLRKTLPQDLWVLLDKHKFAEYVSPTAYCVDLVEDGDDIIPNLYISTSEDYEEYDPLAAEIIQRDFGIDISSLLGLNTRNRTMHGNLALPSAIAMQLKAKMSELNHTIQVAIDESKTIAVSAQDCLFSRDDTDYVILA